MKKLNDLIAGNNVTVYGSEVFKILESCNDPALEGHLILADESPAAMLARGITQYYAPVLPHGAGYSTIEDIFAADLDCVHVSVSPAPEILPSDNVLIAAEHPGIVKLLLDKYPDAELSKGDVTPDMVRGRDVVGILPIVLVQHCRRYKAVTIYNFDHAADKDLDGMELKDRIRMHRAVTVVCG